MAGIVGMTILLIKPTNDLLLGKGRVLGPGEAASLLQRWQSLHAVRTVVSVAAFVALVFVNLAT